MTLFELQCDCWLCFAKMSKKSLLQFIQDITYITADSKKSCSEIDINYFSSHHNGNIKVHIRPFQQPDDGVVVRQLFVNSYAGNYNQESVLHLLKTPSKTRRPELWEGNLGVNNNLLQVLGLLKCACIGKRRIPSVPDDSDEAFDDDNYEQLLNLRADIVDESDQIPHTSSDFLYDDYVQHVSAKDFKDILLGSHQFILEDILISLRRCVWTME